MIPPGLFQLFNVQFQGFVGHACVSRKNKTHHLNQPHAQRINNATIRCLKVQELEHGFIALKTNTSLRPRSISKRSQLVDGLEARIISTLPSKNETWFSSNQVVGYQAPRPFALSNQKAMAFERYHKAARFC
jgi:hypothetical protein